MRTREALFSNSQLPRTAAARARKGPKGVVIPRKPAGKKGPTPITNMQQVAPGVVLISGRKR